MPWTRVTAQERSPRTGTALLLGGTALNARALEAAGRISMTGARVMHGPQCRDDRGGRGRFQPLRCLTFPEDALPFLADVKHLILVESEPPVSFFAYPDIAQLHDPGAAKYGACARGEDGTAALEALADPRTRCPAHDRIATSAPLPTMVR